MVSPMHNKTAVSRALERQMRNWELGKTQHFSTAAVTPKLHPFVTISQMVGAGGEAVAEQLGELLGWPVFDKQLLLTMAVDDAARAHVLASMDERDPNWFERTFRSLQDVQFRKADYVHRLRDTENAGIPNTSFKYSEDTGQFQVIREQAGTFADALKLWGKA